MQKNVDRFSRPQTGGSSIMKMSRRSGTSIFDNLEEGASERSSAGYRLSSMIGRSKMSACRRFGLLESKREGQAKEVDPTEQYCGHDLSQYLELLGLGKSDVYAEISTLVNLYPILRLLQTCAHIEKVDPDNKICSGIQIMDQIADNLESVTEQIITKAFCAKKFINCVELIKFMQRKLSPFF